MLLKAFYEKNESLIMLVMMIVFSIILVFIITMLFVSAHRSNKQAKIIASKKRKNYIFVINFESETVIYFEKANPKMQVSLKLESFYTHIIDPRSRDLFRTWLENVFNDNRNLLTEITMNLDGRHIVPLYFTIDSLEQEQHIVHLSSYSVEFLNDYSQKKHFFLASVNESKGINIDTIFTKKSVNSGLLLFIRFFALDKRIDQARQTTMLNELRQVCFLYLKEKKSRFRIEYDDANSFVIYDTGYSSLSDMQRSTISLIKKLNSRLEIHSYQNDFGFSIGAVETKYFADGKKCLDVALNKSVSAERQENRFDWFLPGDGTEEFSSQLWEEELESVIKSKKRERKLRYLFQPMVQSIPLKMFGYYATIEPENSSFRNIEEMKIKANEYGKNAELLQVICRALINKFYNESIKRTLELGHNNELKLFIPISTYDKDCVIKVLSDIRHTRDCNIVLVIDEDEMNELVARSYEEVITDLHAMRKKGYQIALLLRDGNLTWANGVYESFDFFIIDKSLTTGEESLASSSVIKRLTSKLASFHRTMIALDMDNKSMIHILRDKDFTVFAGNIIESPNEDFIELTTRKMNVIRK